MTYKIVFNEVILNQLQKLKENAPIRIILTKMFNKIEETGLNAGKLLDVQLHLYELKNKHPPIRLYFKQISQEEILLFEYEIKTSEKKQNQTIAKIKHKIILFFKTLNLSW